MTYEIEKYLPFVFPFLFVILWFVVTNLLRVKANMVKELEVYKGSEINDSGWGSAIINGVSANNCVKVISYEYGYLIKMMGVFGGGKLWLPKDSIKIVKQTEKRFIFLPASKKLRSDDNNVTLYGKLADQIV